MSTKNVLAYFRRYDQAEKVAEQLKSQLGVDEVQISRISKYPGDGIEEITNPITGNVDSIGELTSDADVDGTNAGVLVGADISSSGMSGGREDITGFDVLLVASRCLYPLGACKGAHHFLLQQFA